MNNKGISGINSVFFSGLSVGLIVALARWSREQGLADGAAVRGVDIRAMTSVGALTLPELPDDDAGRVARVAIASFVPPCEDVYLVRCGDTLALVLLSDGRTVWPTVTDAPPASALLEDWLLASLRATNTMNQTVPQAWAQVFPADDKPKHAVNGTAGGFLAAARATGCRSAGTLETLPPETPLISVTGDEAYGSQALFLMDGRLLWSTAEKQA